MKLLPSIRFSRNYNPARPRNRFRLVAACLILLFGRTSYAQSDWLANPVDNDWFNPANWSTGTVPGPFDTVHFKASSLTEIELTQDGSGVDDILFDAGASSYTITALPGMDFFLFDSVVNTSGVEQNFISLADENGSGSFNFNDAMIAGLVTFTQHASSAGGGLPPRVIFTMSSAGGGTYHNLGANVAGGQGGRVDFPYTSATAERSTIINGGGNSTGRTRRHDALSAGLANGGPSHVDRQWRQQRRRGRRTYFPVWLERRDGAGGTLRQRLSRPE